MNAQEEYDIDFDKNDNTDRYFPGQQKNEEILIFSRLHPIVLFPHAAMFITSIILFPMIMHGFKAMTIEFESIWIQALFLLFFFGYTFYFHTFFNKVLNYYLNIVILTDYRVVQLKKTIFFCNNKDAIDLYKIQDLKKDQFGLFCTLFNYGSVVIEVSAIHETKCIYHIPDPEKWFHALNQAKRRYIDNRKSGSSVKAEGIGEEIDINIERKTLHSQMLRTL